MGTSETRGLQSTFALSFDWFLEVIMMGVMMSIEALVEENVWNYNYSEIFKITGWFYLSRM